MLPSELKSVILYNNFYVLVNYLMHFAISPNSLFIITRMYFMWLVLFKKLFVLFLTPSRLLFRCLANCETLPYTQSTNYYKKPIVRIFADFIKKEYPPQKNKEFRARVLNENRNKIVNQRKLNIKNVRSFPSPFQIWNECKVDNSNLRN